MNIKMAEKFIPEKEMMRDVYSKTLINLAHRDERVVALDSDLMKSMGIIPFCKAHPTRTFNCGVQEANMIGVAAGLSATGKVPFAHSFGVFATRRCFDQVFLSAAYAKLNIRIIGSDPGITAAFNGGTHISFEDMGLMRAVPGSTVIEPVDSVMLANLMDQLLEPYGVFYMRLVRKHAVSVFKKGSTFKIGKAITLQSGSDVTIIATGLLVSEALTAAETLSKKGISARVLNVFTLKPLDREAVIKCANETGAIVTAENHSIYNGLGSAVAEVLTESSPVPMLRIGAQDRFGQVGPLDYLKREYGLDAENIVKQAENVLKLKR